MLYPVWDVCRKRLVLIYVFCSAIILVSLDKVLWKMKILEIVDFDNKEILSLLFIILIGEVMDIKRWERFGYHLI